MALVASVFATGAAVAADLPSKKITVTEVTTTQRLPFFLGINGGYDTDTENGTVGAVAGYEFFPWVRAEIAYDHLFQAQKAIVLNYAGVKDSIRTGADVLTGNLVLQYPVGSFTPYVLGGVGYRWDDYKDQAVYALGGGLRYALTERVELDGRYRYIADFDGRRHDNVITAGVNIRF